MGYKALRSHTLASFCGRPRTPRSASSVRLCPPSRSRLPTFPAFFLSSWQKILATVVADLALLFTRKIVLGWLLLAPSTPLNLSFSLYYTSNPHAPTQCLVRARAQCQPKTTPETNYSAKILATVAAGLVLFFTRTTVMGLLVLAPSTSLNLYFTLHVKLYSFTNLWMR